MEKDTDPIKLRAYQLWEDAGRPEGGAEEFWYQAEREQSQGDIGDEASAQGFVRDVDTQSTDTVRDAPAETQPKKTRKPRAREKA